MPPLKTCSLIPGILVDPWRAREPQLKALGHTLQNVFQVCTVQRSGPAHLKTLQDRQDLTYVKIIFYFDENLLDIWTERLSIYARPA